MSTLKGPKTRKPHRKSRNGCLPCKARHVKCDEQRPACFNCDKYGSTCEYPKPKGKVSADATHSPTGLDTPSSTQSLTTSHPNTGLEPKPDIGASLNIRQLRLLHHFTTDTGPTLAAHHGAEEVYTSYMVKLAFNNPYLLHAILALSALHLRWLEPDRRAEHLFQAHLHYDAALAGFRLDVKDVDESNFQPVLLFSNLLFPYALALALDAASDLEHAFDILLSNLILTRGVRPILTTHGLFDAMKASPLGRLVPDDIRGLDWDADPPAGTEVVQLRKFSEAVHHVYPPDIIEAYKDAIRSLQILFSATQRRSDPPSDSLLKTWIHHICPRFVELLGEKQPGALIIFAYYGVLLGRGHRYWFREGVDEQILRIAEYFVPTEWKSWLDWPREQIQGGISSLTVNA